MKSNLFRGAIAALVAMFAIGGAYALSVDQTRTMVQRYDPDGYHANYYRVTINYNDPGIASGQAFGALARNEFITDVSCHVTTAFNASSTNVVTFGTTKASANEIVASSGANASITGGSATYQKLTAAPGLGVNATSAADVTLYAKYAQTGTAASAGRLTCVIETVPNNDM